MRYSILTRYPTLASQEDTGRAAGAGVAEKHQPTHRDFEGSWGSDLALCIARAGSILGVRTFMNRADYGVSVTLREGSAVRTREAAGSSGLSGGASNGRCSWLN